MTRHRRPTFSTDGRDDVAIDGQEERSSRGGRLTADEPERALLVAVAPSDPAGAEASSPWDTAASLDELGGLALSAGLVPVAAVSQRLRSRHPRTYVNEGKAAELAERMRDERCDLLIVDDELTPAQQKGLEEICGAGRVVDRTALIIDIFAQRARTHEGKLQVQLAQERYSLPRLTRLWTHLERQRGGTGTRGGSGEMQIESDRRQIRARITRLEQELEGVRRGRATRRARRAEGGRNVSLIGYTNAGKSTLLNRLTRGGAEAENKLFATLDPTTRRWPVQGSDPLLLTDTVGFIHKLPAGLVAAFRATLEELNDADLVLHVVDASSPLAVGQADVALAEVRRLHVDAPVLTAFNKVDMVATEERAERLAALWHLFPDAVAISAETGEGLDLLARRTLKMLTVSGRAKGPR